MERATRPERIDGVVVQVKPCPFCGVKPSAVRVALTGLVRLVCTNPACGVLLETKAAADAAAAAALWNERNRGA